MKKQFTWVGVIRYLAVACLFIACAALSGYLGFKAPQAVVRGTPIWLHTGIYLALYYLWGWRAFPVIIASSYFTNSFLAQRPFWICTALTITHIVGVYLGSAILKPLRQSSEERYYFSEIPRMTLAAAVTPFLNAVVGTFYNMSIADMRPSEAIAVFSTWWVGMFLGSLLVTPIIIAWWQNRRASAKAWLEFAGIILLSIPILYFIFFTSEGYVFIFGIFPILLGAAWVLPRNLFLTSVFLLNATAIFATFMGVGPFRAASVGGNLINLQIFLGTVSITSLALEGFRQNASRPAPIITLLCGWILSGTIYYIFAQNQNDKDVQRTRNLVKEMTHEINEYMAIHVDILHLSQGFLNNINHFDRARWQSFVTQMKTAKNYPSILSLGIIFDIARQQTLQFSTFMRDRGYPSFDIHPMSPPRKRQLIVSFIAPEEKDNMRMIGLDILSLGEPLKAALHSSAINLVPVLFPEISEMDTSSRQVFTLGLPFYGKDVTFRDYRLALMDGFIFATIDINEFFRTIINRRPREMAVEIFSGHETTGKRLFVSEAKALQPASPYEFVTTLPLAQYPFTIGWRRSTIFASSQDLSAVILSSTTTLLTLFLAGMIANLQMVGQRAERIALEKTRELEKQRVIAIHSAKMASLGEMAGGIAHEINNPLAIIHGMTQILQVELVRNTATQEQIQRRLKVIEQTSIRISKIITGLRTFSRPSENDPLLPESLRLIMEQTLGLCRERFAASNISLVVSSVPDIEINCRATQISQILLNLLSNSHDAIERLPERWIKIDFEDRQSYIAILITDSGPPIPTAIRDKIFQPFYTTKDSKHGTGLGLSISQSLAQAHQGRLYLNEKSCRTSFILELPKSLRRSSAEYL